MRNSTLILFIGCIFFIGCKSKATVWYLKSDYSNMITIEILNNSTILFPEKENVVQTIEISDGTNKTQLVSQKNILLPKERGKGRKGILDNSKLVLEDGDVFDMVYNDKELMIFKDSENTYTFINEKCLRLE